MFGLIGRGLLRFLRVSLIDGPREIARADQSVWDVLFPWPVRLIIVFGAWALGRVFGDTPAGIQLGWGLQYGLFIAIAIVISFWSLLLVLNAALAGLWLYLTRRRLAPKVSADKNKPEWDVLDVVTWLNRQVSHVEVFATYVAIACVLTPRLVYQLPLVAGVLALGGPIVDGITQRKWYGGVEARVSRPTLLKQRRLLIYILSAVGLFFLSLWAPGQFWVFFPLLATAAPGLVLRIWRYWTRHAQMRDPRRAPLLGREGQAEQLSLEEAVKSFSDERARLQQHATPWFAPALALVTVAAVVGFVAWQSERVAQAASDERDGPAVPADTCSREAGGPIAPAPITMFLIADSQLHELGGTRFPGQMEVASTIVPVARRPIELDVLSAAAVIRFGDVYDQVSRSAAPGSTTLWAHLGDFADLSCSREIDRMTALLDRYGGKGSRRLAGVAPGNHDSSFTGNFDWNPYWGRACEDDDPVKAQAGQAAPVYARLDKTRSDAAIRKLLDDHLAPGGSTGVVHGGVVDGLWRASPTVWGNPTARYTVTPLGVLSAGTARKRGVVGIFIDTADLLTPDNGIAGAYGAFSEKQAKAIEAAVATLKHDNGADYADPWYVVFGHSPYGELTGASREALDGLFASLDVRSDACEPGDDVCNGPRTLALVTAHTHHAEAHRHCVNGRLLREMVVGSVIDPPQQAAKLEIGINARGRASVRLSTLPAVSRDGRTCEPQLGLPAGRCHHAVAALTGAKECMDLVDGPGSGGERGKSCEELERPLTWQEQLTGLVRHGGPRDPALIMDAETKRTRALTRCLCREDAGRHIKAPAACRDREPPLHAERYAAVVEALASDPARAEEITCLGWAASAVHAHKANGMTMADALRCGFDDPTLPAARVLVSASDDEACP